MSADVRVTGDLLPKRISLPTLCTTGQSYEIELTTDGNWNIRSLFRGDVPREGHSRDGDTGENTEWMVYPTWSKGYGMSVDLLRGQTVTITIPGSVVPDSGSTLLVTITDGANTVVESTYRGVFLVVREMTARPVDMSKATVRTFL